MTHTRQVELLEKAAAALSEGRDPFERWFLQQNAVTLDEAYDMADFVASAIRLSLLWTQRGTKRSKKESK